MKRRVHKKYLTAAARFIADGCQLYASHPRSGPDEHKFEELARALLEMNLLIAFDHWSRHGPSHIRHASVVKVTLKDVERRPEHLLVAGSVRWSRRRASADVESADRFRIECPIVGGRCRRPTVVLEATGMGAT